MDATICRQVAIPTRFTALTATLLIVACSASDTRKAEAALASRQPATAPATQAAAEQLNACSLLTKAEVETAVGRAVKTPVGDTTANMFGCNYGDPKDPAGLDKVVVVGVLVANDSAAAREVLEMARSNAGKAESITGLGDVAFWDDAPRLLQVTKGHYEVSLNLSQGVGGRDTARKLAELLLTRLRR